ncbi:MAG: hypothetical protein HKN47_27320 [Pirellulaceae bacterium]|nr:hypothetical protein [Pirellulaceae bacterium]
MGSRAGFIVKRNGVAKAYGSRHAGSSTVEYLLRGPDVATKKFRSIDEMAELDDVLGGEGGAAIIDWDERVVIWMMSNCRLPVHQRLCNAMIGQAFEGWTVRMAHDLYEISEQAGIDTSKYVSQDDGDWQKWEQEVRASDLSQEEMEQVIRDAHEDRRTTEKDAWEPADVPEKIESFEQIDNEGAWIMVRRSDGTVKDYYGFSPLQNYLLRGKAFAESLAELPSIDRIPHELVVTEGLLIDETDKVVWRWPIGRVQALEQQIAKCWDGWTFRETPGANWAGQVELSGREASELACPPRNILGLVVAEHAPYASGDVGAPGLAGIISAVRKGCLGLTLILAVATVAVYLLSQSVGFTIALGILLALCVAATIFVYKKSAIAIRTLDLDVSPEQSNDNMDRILRGLSYPTIAELRANGEIPRHDDYDDDEGDDDDEES